MRKIVLIGIGTGHPDHITVEGVNALNGADLVLLPTKGADKADLADLRRGIVARHGVTPPAIRAFALPVRAADNPAYLDGVGDWHAAIAALYGQLLGETQEDATVALLVWGDPSLYDSTLRILARVRAAGLDFSLRVVPGITAIQALTAAFCIPLNTLGAPVLITTGRRLAEGWPTGADTVAVMLDGKQIFMHLVGRDLHIWWGAYLGSADQMLIEGTLDAVADRIVEARAAARARHGWIMDTYLLRRR